MLAVLFSYIRRIKWSKTEVCQTVFNSFTVNPECQSRHSVITYEGIFVKPQQWPTPSESIAIYCVRKLVSCITHLQSCAKVDIWNKKKKLRTVAKIKPQGYKNCRLPKFGTNVTLPLYTATTLFNEPRSQRPFGTSDWQYEGAWSVAHA